MHAPRTSNLFLACANWSAACGHDMEDTARSLAEAFASVVEEAGLEPLEEVARFLNEQKPSFERLRAAAADARAAVGLNTVLVHLEAHGVRNVREAQNRLPAETLRVLIHTWKELAASDEEASGDPA